MNHRIEDLLHGPNTRLEQRRDGFGFQAPEYLLTGKLRTLSTATPDKSKMLARFVFPG